MSRKRQNAVGKKVFVIDDNVTMAIKKLRRILRQNNVFTQLKQRQTYIKPSTIKKNKKSYKQWKCKIWNEQRHKKLLLEK